VGCGRGAQEDPLTETKNHQRGNAPVFRRLAETIAVCPGGPVCNAPSKLLSHKAAAKDYAPRVFAAELTSARSSGSSAAARPRGLRSQEPGVDNRRAFFKDVSEGS